MGGGKWVTRYDKPIPESIGGDESHDQPEGKAQEFTACQFTGRKCLFRHSFDLCLSLFHNYLCHCDLPSRSTRYIRPSSSSTPIAPPSKPDVRFSSAVAC